MCHTYSDGEKSHIMTVQPLCFISSISWWFYFPHSICFMWSSMQGLLSEYYRNTNCLSIYIAEEILQSKGPIPRQARRLLAFPFLNYSAYGML